MLVESFLRFLFSNLVWHGSNSHYLCFGRAHLWGNIHFALPATWSDCFLHLPQRSTMNHCHLYLALVSFNLFNWTPPQKNHWDYLGIRSVHILQKCRPQNGCHTILEPLFNPQGGYWEDHSGDVSGGIIWWPLVWMQWFTGCINVY